jgi:hypothetical protein
MTQISPERNLNDPARRGPPIGPTPPSETGPWTKDETRGIVAAAGGPTLPNSPPTAVFAGVVGRVGGVRPGRDERSNPEHVPAVFANDVGKIRDIRLSGWVQQLPRTQQVRARGTHHGCQRQAPGVRTTPHGRVGNSPTSPAALHSESLTEIRAGRPLFPYPQNRRPERAGPRSPSPEVTRGCTPSLLLRGRQERACQAEGGRVAARPRLAPGPRRARVPRLRRPLHRLVLPPLLHQR